MNKDYPIDIVIPWVDGTDPEWINSFNKWSNEAKKEGSDSRSERYNDYGTLRYIFRGIEKFTPWVRTVHFITCGQKPDWLNLDNPKLHWVKHSDYIPEKYLPVFSSHPIELMMHKIPGLADHFIYLNDDFFFTSKINQSFFFKNGVPCDYAGFTTLGIGSTRIPHVILNNLIEISNNFSRKEIIKKHFFKWFTFQNGTNVFKTICTTPFNRIDGIVIRHFAQPFIKETLEKVWSQCPEALQKTMGHRFRNRIEDVNQWLFRFWNLCEGNFHPTKCYKFEHFFKIAEMKKKDLQSITNHRYKVICIDDDTDEKSCVDYNERMKKILEAFEKILPEKSDFEL